jgi:bacteriorhodopsin
MRFTKLKMNWLVGHGSVAVVVFLCMVGKEVHSNVQRRLQSEPLTETTEIEQAIMVEASNVSVMFSAIFFFLLGVLIVGQHIQGDLHIVQRSIVSKRLEYSLFVCLYICFFSCLFNVIQYGPQDDAIFDQIDARDTVILDLGRPIEWILTCPLMQLILPIIGGEKVPDWRRITMPLNSEIILVFGCCAMFSQWLLAKLGFYCCGVFCFMVLVYQMHRCVVESTSGAETLFWGQSSIRVLSVIVAYTWVPFPIWYALSPEGFNVIQNSAAMKIAVAFLNVLSKGAFIYYLMRIRGDLEVKEMVMAELNNGQEQYDRKHGTSADDKADHQRVSAKLSSIIYEVLQAMGRQSDFEALKEVLTQHMITTQEDLMVLTPEYCESIFLPYGFVTACKAKIRQRKVENQETWHLSAEKKPDNFDSHPAATAPLPPQVANDPRKLKEHHRRLAAGYAPSNSPRLAYDNEHWNDGLIEGPKSTWTPLDEQTSPSLMDLPALQNSRDQGMSTDELQAAIAASQGVVLNELREMKRSQNEEHSRLKNLEAKMEMNMDEVESNMGGMIMQVMNTIESHLDTRLRSQERVSNREQANMSGRGETPPEYKRFKEMTSDNGHNSA